MQLHIDSRALHDVEADWLIVGVPDAPQLPASVAALDEVLSGLIVRLRESKDVTGNLAEFLALHNVPELAARRLLLLGLGQPAELNVARVTKAMMTAARHVSTKVGVRVAVSLREAVSDAVPVESLALTVSNAMLVGCVGQTLYKAEPGRFPLEGVRLVVGPEVELAAVEPAAQRGAVLADAMNLTRELVNRPAQEIFPASFAARAEQVAAEHGFGCTVLDEGQLRAEKMGSLLAVAAGSARPPRLVVLHYLRGGTQAPTLGLVGKGVTFDSGGLSLKTTEHMLTMKCDMAGAATVLGAMTAIARLKLPVNVMGFLGLVENMVSGTSYKLGDVLTARNGVTIEVQNTDAEGRLVLADVLSYAVDRGAQRLIDLATLTGACVVALGEEVTGLFTNNQSWCDAVIAAAGRCGEDVWQLPMFDHYAELIKSDVADVKNVGGRAGGAITAAKFLEKFVGQTPWVHLDIAGPSFASSNKPHREGGATGCMVRTIVETAAGLIGSTPFVPV